MKDTTQFPCWVFLGTHPVQIQRADTRRAWNFLRRHGWSQIRPERVSLRLRELCADLGMSESDAWLYFSMRAQEQATALGTSVFIRLWRGIAPPIAYDAGTLELLSDVFCVPMDYFYRMDVHSVPVLFGKRQRRIAAQRLIQPLEEDGQALYDRQNQLGRPVVAPPGVDKFYASDDDKALRVYHLLYTTASEQHRCHVVAHTKQKAIETLRYKYPDAEVLESSSQKVQPGLFLHAY